MTAWSPSVRATKAPALVRCTTCGKRKKPIGRDAGIAIDNYCYDYGDGYGCSDYHKDPRPAAHWPGEDIDGDAV